MHRSMLGWFGHPRSHEWEREGCGPRGHGRGHGPWAFAGPSGGSGVRRPLRFLIHKLDLSEKQATQLARILDELKTERAQSEVDDRRTTASFADALAGDTFDDATATAAAKRRAESAERVANAVLEALRQIHALLEPEQREIFAYLTRSGALEL